MRPDPDTADRNTADRNTGERGAGEPVPAAVADRPGPGPRGDGAPEMSGARPERGTSARRDGLLRTGVLIRHNTAVMLHEPGPLIGRLVMPLILLLALRPLYEEAQGPGGTGEAVVGSLVTFSLLAMSIVGSSILSERAWRTWDRLRATPVRPAELLVGKSVPVLGMLAAQQVLVLGFGVVVFGMPVAAPGLLIAACAAWGLALLGMGTAVGVLVRSYGQLSAVFDIGGLFFTTLGGALVPLSTLPGWVREVSPVSPGYWAAESLRHAAAGDAAPTLKGVGVLLAVAAAGAATAAWRVARGWGRATAV